MELTERQKEGVRIAIQRYKNHEKYTVIAGYAGTGKSTVVEYIVKELGLKNEDVAYCAYTGRAAKVLRDKNCPNAMTTHRLLFNSHENADGTFTHIPKDNLACDYKLIVVDEVSMLPKYFFELMLKHGVHIICLGDPGQLPPVATGNDTDHHLLDHPHVFLDEIMRQAADNEIIKLSMDIRNGEPLLYQRGKDVCVIPYNKLSDKIMLGADIMLCATNKKRIAMNQYCREVVYGEDVPPYPLSGEKIICLKNNYQYENDSDTPLINGSVGTISDIDISPSKLFGHTMMANFNADDGMFYQIPMDYKMFTEHVETINKDNFKKFRKEKVKPCLFDYAYCCTVHKAQGGQYDRVIVFVENFPHDAETRKKWLYTAVTRAASKLIIVM